MSAERVQSEETHIVILGVGLIGGSIAAALRRKLPGCRITGIGRSEDRLRQARECGLIDFGFTTACRDSFPEGSLAVVCLPVDQIAEAVKSLSRVGSPRTLITDAGSVKSSVYRQLNGDDCALGCFVGAHPVAGGEQAGFEHARGDLFDGRVCVVTPESASVDQLKRVSAFWELLGCRVFIMSADEHDRILALTSHLPHVLAATAASCVSSEMLPFTGTGFRDTTRIAEGSPRLWTEILRGNRVHMLQAVRAAQAVLSGVEAALDADDMMALELLLSRAAAARRAVREYHRSDGHIAKQPLDSGLANTES